MPLRFEAFESEKLNWLVSALLQTNILWGVINLFPIQPLDGGRVARELLVRANPVHGERNSLVLSLVAAVCLAVFHSSIVSSWRCSSAGWPLPATKC